MANLGLQACPNTSIVSKPSVPKIIGDLSSATTTATESSSTDTIPNSNKSKAVELFDIPESDIIPKKTKAQRMLPVSINDQKYMIRLLTKYGTDYYKMARDIKLNDMQHTESYLKKLGSRFCLLSETQRRVEIPDHVMEFMC